MASLASQHKQAALSYMDPPYDEPGALPQESSIPNEPVKFGEDTFGRGMPIAPTRTGGISAGGYTGNVSSMFADQTKKLASAQPSSSRGTLGTPARPTGSVSTSKTIYAGEAPEMGDIPTLKKPEEWSPSKVAGEVQKKSALGLKLAKRSLREATASLGRDPMSSLMMRRALESHGINTERTLTGARQEVEAEEWRDMQMEYNVRSANWQAKIQHTRDKFQAAWNKWAAGGTRVTTTTPTYGMGEGTSGRVWEGSMGTKALWQSRQSA